MEKIALFGGSFNPFGLHHLAIVKAVVKLGIFKKTYIIPCGVRDDYKKTVNEILPVHRASMIDLSCKRLPKSLVSVDLRDLENGRFTRAIDLEKKYADRGEIWHVIGYDLVKGFRQGKAEIQTWKEWKKLFYQSRFAVVKRAGYGFNPRDLPPKSIVINLENFESGSEIRTRIFNHQPFKHLVTEETGGYIETFGLYRGIGCGRKGGLSVEKIRPKICFDRGNKESTALAESFRDCREPKQILAFGGDGFLLSVIRRYWRMRLPVFGINTGTRGHLLNHFPGNKRLVLPKEWVVYNLPILKVEAVLKNGRIVSAYASNEIRVRTKTNYRRRKLEGANQKIEIIGPISKLIPFDGSDGLAVSTPQGSHGWTKSMGAPVISLESGDLMLARDNPYTGHWRFGGIPEDSEVIVTNLSPEKRPVNLFADSWWIGEMIEARIKTSKIANIQLAFDPEQTLPLKYAREDLE